MPLYTSSWAFESALHAELEEASKQATGLMGKKAIKAESSLEMFMARGAELWQRCRRCLTERHGQWATGADLILIHEGWQHCEGRAGLGHNGDGNSCAHPVLPLLNLEVVQQSDQHILRPNSFGNVAKCVDSGSSDALFVCLQHLQQLKADSHPLSGRHIFRATVSNAAHKVNAVLLHLKQEGKLDLDMCLKAFQLCVGCTSMADTRIGQKALGVHAKCCTDCIATQHSTRTDS